MKKNIMKTETKEMIKPSPRNFRFINLKVSNGNDSTAVLGIIKDKSQRQIINDLIIAQYPNIEQVGFVDLDPEKPELMMAGGEFCGDLTQLTAFLALKGAPGEVQIKSSGVSRLLKAGVNKAGDAFAEMPILKNPKKIKTDPDGYIVELEGIIQYVTFNSSFIKGLSDEEIKKIGKEKIDQLGLTEYPAAGIIYADQDDKGWKIKPVVWVRDVQTLYAETACGSGTAALGQILALKDGKSIKDLEIIQPSGLPIKVSVEFDGKKFGYAQISGPVSILNTGIFEQGRSKNFVIERVINQDQLSKYIEEGWFVQLYDRFEKEPYFEKFSPEDINSFFQEYLDEGLLFVAKDKNEVVGFGAVLPIEKNQGVLETIKAQRPDILNGFSLNQVQYMADLVVKEELEGNGIGTKLVKERLKVLKKGTLVIMRTSVENEGSQSIYESLGFQRIPNLIQMVKQKRIDGTETEDPRIFMMKKI